MHSEPCLAYREVTSHARTQKGVAGVKGVSPSPVPGRVDSGLALPCSALCTLAQFLFKEEFTPEKLNEKNNSSFVQDPRMW